MKKITVLMLFFSTMWGYSQTQCSDVTEFFEDFEAYPNPTSVDQKVPDCWGRAVGPAAGAISSINVQPTDGSNRLYLSANTTAPSTALASMPPVSNLLVGNHRLRFTAYSTSNSKTLDVGYYDAGGNFVLGQTLNLPASFAAIQTFTVNPATWTPAIPAGTKVLVFRNANNTLTAIYIDNVAWEPIPNACAADVKAPMGVSQITNAGAVLSWTAGGSETAWQSVYSADPKANPYSLTGTNVPGTSPTVSLSGLTAATKYRAWVRSKCTDGSLGAWVGPLPFITACNAATEMNETFEGANSASYLIPGCWKKVAGNPGIGTSPTPAIPSGSNYMTIAGGYSATPYTIVALPPLSNTGAGDHRLRFKASITAAGLTDGTQMVIGWLGDINNTDSFHELVSVTDLVTDSWKSYTFSFGTAPASPYLALKNPGNVASSMVKIDDVIWEVIPTCANISAVSADLVTSNSAQFSWTKGGTESAWQYVMTSGTETDPSKLSALTVPTPTVVGTTVSTAFTSLTPNTTYKVWLRSKCDNGAFGNYSDPVLIKTPCSPITDFVQYFDSSQNMPDCWAMVGTPYVAIGTPTSANGVVAPTAPNSVSVPHLTLLAMPAVSNISDGTHRLSFKYQADGPASVDVGYLRNAADANSFVSLISQPLACTTAFQSATLNFGADAAQEGAQVLAIKSTGSGSIKIDNVKWLASTAFSALENDEYAGAIALKIGSNFAANSIIETNVGATTSTQAAPSCGGYNGSDVWNSVVVPESGNVTFEINTDKSTNVGVIKNTAAAVYSSSQGVLGSLITCNDSSSTAGDDHPKISVTGRTKGEVLYLRVWENGGNESGTFAVSAYDNTLGVDVFETNNFTFYPNPVKDVLNLSLNQEISNVTVHNLLGQQVISQSTNGNEVKIDLSNLSKGAYLVRMISNNDSKTIKVIKE